MLRSMFRKAVLGRILVRRNLVHFSGTYMRFSRICSAHSSASECVSERNKWMSVANTVFVRNSPRLPSLLPFTGDSHKGLNVELVDPDLWPVSAGLSIAFTDPDKTPRMSKEGAGEKQHYSLGLDEETDWGGLDDMRIHGALFYKVEKGSQEFEECYLRYKGRISSRSKLKASKTRVKTKDEVRKASAEPDKTQTGARIQRYEIILPDTKKRRTPTFNQLTAPYHEPFCLDIFISKRSVRASIIHRVTSKVVAVAHSISKDMKSDLVSAKGPSTCAAVGGVLAQRAIADDIYIVVYTPRKGEKIEGKLKIVLQSIIDGGVDVRVKIKQPRPMRTQN